MIRPCLLVFVEDLNFQAHFQDIAESKRIDCYPAGRGEQLSQLAKTLNPFLFVADISVPDVEWLFKHITQIRFSRPELPIIAIFNPVETDRGERAVSYGCDFVLPRSEIFRKLPELVDHALRKGR